ncbi:MAG: hypothetical protein EPO40_29545 [Myxococcaceae bacterium]|nr:MAG: hypothetical protein EPO40_29545 [Myxococcaceae bacterium]
MNKTPRILSAIALTALVGVLTAPAAQAQQVDATTDYQQVARRYYRTRRSHRHAPPAPPPVAAAPAAAAHAPVVASPARVPAPAPVVAAPVVAAPARAPAVAAPAPAPAPVLAAPAPAPVVEAPAPAPAATPLPVRHGRPLVMAARQTYPSGGWKILVGFGGLGLALFLWKRRVPVSTLSLGCEIQVVNRTSIGGKCELIVVDVGGQRMLLGATSGSVQYLAAIDAPELASAAAPDKTAGFESMFAAARSRTRERGIEPRPREMAAERPRDTSRSPLNPQPLRSEAPARRSSAPEGQVAGLLALGVLR